MPAYLVDNVAATGATIEAAARVIAGGVGLVWASVGLTNPQPGIRLCCRAYQGSFMGQLRFFAPFLSPFLQLS